MVRQEIRLAEISNPEALDREYHWLEELGGLGCHQDSAGFFGQCLEGVLLLSEV